MQGYDSVAMDVDAEIGGSDQLFNMLAGRTLLKNLKNKEKFVITCPLLEGLDGRKMSKTYNNTVNITDEPFEMFGKIMSMGDELIIKYFRLCTDLSVAEIDQIDRDIKNGANPRDAKMRLAAEIITLYHDAKAAEAAHEQFVNVFKNKGIPDEIPEFKLNGDRNIIDLIELCKLVDSRAEAKRAVLQGGVKINDDKITDPQATVHLERDMIVQVGKRRFAKII
ncbi:tyrosine--tRNA ligase [Candidatus Peregrinibacteria bacterium]|nr:MAG: tyrosine--tRNA ligase [Candidatus Peregrinibacteria bacterium]